MGRVEDICFYLERLYISRGVPVHIYDGQGMLLSRIGIGKGEEDPFETDRTLYERVRKEQGEKNAPIFIIEDGWAVYYAFVDERENLYVGGPASTASLESEKSRMYHYRRTHGLSQKYLQFPRLTLMEMANQLSMALFGVKGECRNELALLKANHLSPEEEEKMEWEVANYRMESNEQERIHVGYDYERAYLDKIREGNVEYFEQISCEQMQMADRIGKLAEDGIKQYEYMVAVGLSLIARAAIEGGVAPDHAYSMSDVFFQKLAKCERPEEMVRLHLEIQKKFAAMVKKNKERKKSAYYVEQCKDYLAQNIHKPVSVEELAKLIGVNRTYLSSQFSAQEGMSITQYSIKVRLRAAENMLKYSEASIAQIAEYLCFSSQSHFGSQFKKKNGTTPAEYRKQNRNLNFIKNK